MSKVFGQNITFLSSIQEQETKCKCSENPEQKQAFIKVILYCHDPEIDDFEDEIDEKCQGCIKSLEPSESFEEIHICEHQLGSQFMCTMPDLESIIYSLESLDGNQESFLSVKCNNCHKGFPRDSFLKHQRSCQK